MGIFKRTKDIINANINDWLDQIKDPESALREMIREMEDSVSELKTAYSHKIKDKKELKYAVKEMKKSIKRWQERAVMAVDRGKEELAREALKEKARLEKEAGHLFDRLSSLEEAAIKYREKIREMEEKLEEAFHKKQELSFRAQQAREKKETEELLNSVDGCDLEEAFSEIESAIDQVEAEAELNSSYRPHNFKKWERDEAIEKELEELKRRAK